MKCRDLIGEFSSAMAAPSSLSLITNSKLRDSSDLAVLDYWPRRLAAFSGGSSASDSSKPSGSLAVILSG
jgi:hypothetical protein